MSRTIYTRTPQGAWRANDGSLHGGGSSLPPLTWAPPAGWESYQELALPASNGNNETTWVVTLNDNTDYRISQAAVLEKCVTIKGGRNIVWMGGEQRIDRLHRLNEQTQSAIRFYKGDAWTPENALNDGRIIHLEGFYGHGYYASGDLQMNCPEAIVQIQDCHIACGMWGRQTSQGDGGNQPHPDILQPWGGVKELRIDGLTGLVTYQGLMLKSDFNSPRGPVWIRRTNLRANFSQDIELADDLPFGRTWPNYYWWTKPGEGIIRLDSGTVWFSHPTSSLQGGNSPIWPHGSASGSDATGIYVEPLDDTREWDGTGQGRIYSGNPPAGDYVPASRVGFAYESRGHA